MYSWVGATFNATPAQLGNLVLARAVVQALASPLGGLSSSWIPRGLAIGIGCVLWAIFTALFGTVSSVAAGLPLLAVNGLGLALVIPNVQSLVADYYPAGARGRAFGALWLVISLGGMAGSLYATNLGDATIAGVPGWRFVFFSVAAASALVGVLNAVGVHDPAKPAPKGAGWRGVVGISAKAHGRDVGAGVGNGAGSGTLGAGGAERLAGRVFSDAPGAGDERDEGEEEEGGDDDRGWGHADDAGDANDVRDAEHADEANDARRGRSRGGGDEPCGRGGDRGAGVREDGRANGTPSGVGDDGGRPRGSSHERAHARPHAVASSRRWSPHQRPGSARAPPPPAVVPAPPPPPTTLSRLLEVLKIPTFGLIITQGIVGSVPYASLIFLTLYFQLLGMSNAQAAALVATYLAFGGVGGLVGGAVGDAAARVSPNHGRVLMTQVSVGIGVPFAFFIFNGLHGRAAAQSPERPSPALVLGYAATLALFATLTAWPGPCANNPIFAEIVPPAERNLVYAFDRCFEGAVAAGAAPAVGALAQRWFGFDGASTVTGDPARDLPNAAAIGASLLWFLAVPWTACLVIYSGLHWSYPRDKRIAARRAAQAQRIIEMSSPDASPDAGSPTIPERVALLEAGRGGG